MDEYLLTEDRTLSESGLSLCSAMKRIGWAILCWALSFSTYEREGSIDT